MARGKNISDADMRRLREEILGESGRTMSDADREAVRRALDESGRTISDADRARIMQGPRRVHPRGRALDESGRTISDADREVVRRTVRGESGRTISDADRARLLESYINRNDGGIAKKTRVF